MFLASATFCPGASAAVDEDVAPLVSEVLAGSDSCHECTWSTSSPLGHGSAVVGSVIAPPITSRHLLLEEPIVDAEGVICARVGAKATWSLKATWCPLVGSAHNDVLRPVSKRLTTTSCSAETTPDGVVSLEEKRGAQVLFSFVRKLCESEEMESEPEHTHTDIDQTEEHCARQLLCLTEQRTREEPQYIHIDQNEFSHRRHKTQTEEDIAICECKYDEHDPESACGERCLNVLTSTECTPGYCPCGVYCKNQRFQKCEYAKTKLFRTEGRGWGLLANENLKAGQFIIEYCGEVISWKEAKQRSQAYEIQGLRDAFIISLNASESIDATEKGSLARFINHSCKPNCETRKWNVLGEIRVGIFAKQDILDGTELAYDYNFEWYGGAKVRCLCGAPSCSGFLGAKSRGFQALLPETQPENALGIQVFCRNFSKA
ncbi:histone-lysine N-methyltransferase ASHH1 isoform X3 [Prunus yedoensis var. nudiflora]|uniref:Histone-lysine N-methyltransferase ASHH1 isoform X3 n=1 Tax=Prunus yedoensis var. nudiflora TaxID=2094558 RepID=A0A314UE84_PRUYE|nr:histone-lysine N-methyltransferase ASHH1 isoform X3 [Prunus yedoensis var. nudiflora]